MKSTQISSRRLALLAGALLALCASIAHAQSKVDGTVVNGNATRPVGGVEVHLINKHAQPPIDRFMKTDAAGHYLFENVRPDENYSIAVYDATGKLVGTDPMFSLCANCVHTAVPAIDIAQGIVAMRGAGVFPNRQLMEEHKKLLDQCEDSASTAQAMQAIKACDQLIKQSKGDDPLELATAHDNRGDAYTELRKMDLALKDYTQAMKVDPTSALYPLDRGDAYKTVGDWDHAAADYELAFRIDPANKAVIKARADLNALKAQTATAAPPSLPKAPDASRGMGRPAPAASPSPNGKYFALVIGIDKYPAPMHSLKTAVHDAEAIAKDLRDLYGFEVTLLRDGQATRDAILDALTQYQAILKDDDSLLLYYAGHGYAVKNPDGKTYDKAYWLPADANGTNSSHRIIADDLTSDIREIKARHVLVISDSCYAGGLTREGSEAVLPAARQAFVAKMLTGRSRNLMASGGDEPVSDNGPGGHSVFAAAVLNALEKSDGAMFTAQQMFFDEVQPRVAGGADQIPVYSIIKNSGHENGDFVFVRKP